jgi:hypothetical protein
MATITERFGFTKPAGNDPASIVPLNSNTDLIEQYLGRTQDMIAPLYDDTATYDVGDIVTYESNLYKCITAISTAETFDPTKWEATTASEDILTLQNVQGYDEYDETQTYAVGDYAIYNNIVYECTTAVSTAEPFDSTKWTATSIEQIIGGVKGDISQLNSSLTNVKTTKLILYTNDAFVANTPRTFKLNETYNNFLMLCIAVGQYGNFAATMTIPVLYFIDSSSARRPILYIDDSNTYVNVYKSGANNVIVKTSNALSDTYHVSIYGVNRIV